MAAWEFAAIRLQSELVERALGWRLWTDAVERGAELVSDDTQGVSAPFDGDEQIPQGGRVYRVEADRGGVDESRPI